MSLTYNRARTCAMVRRCFASEIVLILELSEFESAKEHMKPHKTTVYRYGVIEKSSGQ